jgi:hypothetical protein
MSTDWDITRLGQNIQELYIKQNILKEEICKLKTVEEAASLEKIWKEIGNSHDNKLNESRLKHAIDSRIRAGAHEEITAELERRLGGGDIGDYLRVCRSDPRTMMKMDNGMGINANYK